MIESKEDSFDKLRQECWNDALHSFGTGFLYSERAKNLKTKLKGISLLGVLVPSLIGAIALGYGIESKSLLYAIYPAVPMGIIQLGLSIVSLNSGWDELYPNYLESALENSLLAREYENLAKFPPSTFEKLKAEKGKIDIKKFSRDKEDNKNSLSSKEFRKGMRWALRNYKRSCAGCKETPISMESTDCPVCGKF